jgi:GT2 family glycosyltransferase
MSRYPGISLVTYTYNDHRMVDELLAYGKVFSVPFQEIVVVDDGSATPYAAPGALPCLVTVIRNDSNTGPAPAKRAGMNAAAGAVVFSLDADIRPHARWLESSLRLLADPAVGLVGSLCIPARNASSLSVAVHRTYPRNAVCDDTEFVQGACLLFRRDVWKNIGGLDDFQQTIYEDWHLSLKVLRYGYRLLQNNLYPVYEKRNLHRTGYCRRHALYDYHLVSICIKKYGIDRYLHNILSKQIEPGIEYFKNQKNPILVYVSFLKTSLCLYHIDNEDGETNGRIFINTLLKLLNVYPKTKKLLQKDIRTLDMKIQFTERRDTALDDFFSSLPLAGVWEALEEKWADVYQAEDGQFSFDWHYSISKLKLR